MSMAASTSHPNISEAMTWAALSRLSSSSLMALGNWPPRLLPKRDEPSPSAPAFWTEAFQYQGQPRPLHEVPSLRRYFLFEGAFCEDARAPEGEDGGDNHFTPVRVVFPQLDIRSLRVSLEMRVDQPECHSVPQQNELPQRCFKVYSNCAIPCSENHVGRTR